VATACERRKRSKLKRICLSEHNYLALKTWSCRGSFNDVISKLIQVQRIQQEKQQEQRDDDNNCAITGCVPFPGKFLGLFDEQDIQRLNDLLGHRRKSNRDNQTNKLENITQKMG
jgi:hypothetical protein